MTLTRHNLSWRQVVHLFSLFSKHGLFTKYSNHCCALRRKLTFRASNVFARNPLGERSRASLRPKGTKSKIQKSQKSDKQPYLYRPRRPLSWPSSSLGQLPTSITARLRERESSALRNPEVARERVLKLRKTEVAHDERGREYCKAEKQV